MPNTYLWQQGNITNPGTMASTTKFNDPVYPDITTAETVTNAPPTAIVFNEMTGMIVFPAMMNLSSVSVTVGSTGYSGNDGSHGTTVVVAYYDGTTWHVFDTNTNFDVGFISTPFDRYRTFVSTVSVLASRVRAYVTGNFHQAGPITMTTGMSDFNATTSAVVIPPTEALASISTNLGLSAVTCIGVLTVSDTTFFCDIDNDVEQEVSIEDCASDDAETAETNPLDSETIETTSSDIETTEITSNATTSTESL